MVSRSAVDTPRAQLHTFVHSGDESVHDLVRNAVLIDALKALESELQSKEMLPAPNDAELHPLWFVAETERNVFLWRNGYSLAQADEFEFWIDWRALIEKRLAQIELQDPQNPFVNPLWSVVGGAPDPEVERAYLEQLSTLLEELDVHLQGLSRAASELSKELTNSGAQAVRLPRARKVK